MLEIYSDGAYSSATDTGGVGLVFVKHNQIIYKWSKAFFNTTNNRCELYAVIKALQSIAKKIDSVKIYSDSQYVINSINLGWQRKKNLDLWKSFDAMYHKAKNHCSNIEFIWVKGHSTNMFNNLADELAFNASKEYVNRI